VLAHTAKTLKILTALFACRGLCRECFSNKDIDSDNEEFENKNDNNDVCFLM
jgi:hypothetical protein